MALFFNLSTHALDLDLVDLYLKWSPDENLANDSFEFDADTRLVSRQAEKIKELTTVAPDFSFDSKENGFEILVKFSVKWEKSYFSKDKKLYPQGSQDFHEIIFKVKDQDPDEYITRVPTIAEFELPLEKANERKRYQSRGIGHKKIRHKDLKVNIAIKYLLRNMRRQEIDHVTWKFKKVGKNDNGESHLLHTSYIFKSSEREFLDNSIRQLEELKRKINHLAQTPFFSYWPRGQRPSARGQSKFSYFEGKGIDRRIERMKEKRDAL